MAVVGVIVVTTEQPGWQPELVSLDEDPGKKSITANITGQRRSPVKSPPESSVAEAPTEDSIQAADQESPPNAPDSDPSIEQRTGDTVNDTLPTRENALATDAILSPETASIINPALEAHPIKAAGEGDATVADTVDSDQGSVSASEPPGMADEKTAVMTGNEPRETAAGRGPWVIYLASLRREKEAEQFIDRVQSRGVSAESHPVTVKGYEYWRVYVPGFATAAEANIEASRIKEKLELADVWVAQRLAMPR
jgi:hypothetical protein